jgi:purine nucleoside phosphorylase
MARFLGLEVVGFSCITNRCVGDTTMSQNTVSVHHTDVVQTAMAASKQMGQLCAALIQSL